MLERNELTSGTSWHAAGIVGPLRASMNLTKLAKYATELFEQLESETQQADRLFTNRWISGWRKPKRAWLS